MVLASVSPTRFLTVKKGPPRHDFNCLPTSRNFTRRFPRLVTCVTQQQQVPELVLEGKKMDLLKSIQDTQRGLVTNPDQRCCIEESMAWAESLRNQYWGPDNVSLEAYCSGEPIDLAKLNGTWRLQYTSASDVLILFESAARFPFLQVGQIFQRFESQEASKGGIVENIVQWSIPSLLEEESGATLLVSAKFSVISARNIYLEFEEINVQNIKISEELQAVIAPALLPRSFISLQILQFLRSFKAQVPVRSQSGGRQVGGLYYLSYLDKNMLLGRAVGGGGVFIFTRAYSLDLS